jgi:hypothetical protein
MTEEALAFLSVCGQLDDKTAPKVIEGKGQDESSQLSMEVCMRWKCKPDT